MATRRLKHADRRSSILEAATAAFAAKGFEGARTLEIAEAAGVSEALVFRHFPSKQALYDAVLERLTEEQDRNIATLHLPEASTRGLVECLWRYFEACVYNPPTSRASVGQRILLLSLAGDGRHAGLLYARAQAIGAEAFAEALEAARREGNLEAAGIAPRNAWNFIEHVGSMITAGRLSGAPVIPYAGSKAALLREAVLFCGRGLGLKEAALLASAPPRGRRATTRTDWS
ncbi:MAG: TetR/AcrR family transcriptional regulator [Myxococcota bacterium]